MIYDTTRYYTENHLGEISIKKLNNFRIREKSSGEVKANKRMTKSHLPPAVQYVRITYWTGTEKTTQYNARPHFHAH